MAGLHHSLSLTQTSEQLPHVFVDSSGTPLSVYLDVNPEILARPRLTRLLRASGADICHNISAAVILLINPETETGRKIVHDWREDAHKLVLDYGWIQASLRTGHALLESDDWGGFRVLHSSECIYSDEEGDEDLEDAQSGTRSKVSAGSTRPKPLSQSRSSEQNVKLDTPSPARRLPALSNRGTSNSMPALSPSSNSTPSAIAPSSPKSTAGISVQHTPIRRHSAPTIHQHALLNLPSSQQGSGPPLTPLPRTADTPTGIPFLSRAPGPSVVPNLPSTVNPSGPQHPPSAGVDLLNALNYAFQIQNTASQVQNAASRTLTQLVETVIAVAQSQGMDTAIIQNYLATLPMSSSAIQQTPPSNVHESILHSVDEYQGTSVSDSPYQDGGKSSARTHTPRVVSSEPSLPAKRRRKSLESLFPSKRPATDMQQDPSGASPEPPQSERGVFSTKNGQPILVFVQIDTRGRHDIVHLIKKSGGKITADIPKAAFVILNPRSVTYNDLRQEADDSRRTIVQASFVTESIKQGRLLDPNDFLLGDASSPKKLHSGGRRPTFRRDRHSLENDHPMPEQTPDAVVDASSARAREHSTTPEPPAPVLTKQGYKFTPTEMTYAWDLVRRIITKDPLSTKLMVVRELHKKMPHHTEASWARTMSRQKDMYEAVRTEALGFVPGSEVHPPDSQHRRGVHHPQNETGDTEMDEANRDTEELEELQVGASLILTEGESMHNDERGASLEGRNADTHEHDAYARDFEALVGFLTSEDADCGREDEIFDRLTAKSPCMTAPSWAIFLDQHAEAVTEEVERRYTAQQAI